MKKSIYFDFVRGISAQMVLFGHALNMSFPAFFMTQGNGGQLVAAPGHFYLQNLGVIIFFVLSGFLVTSSALSGMRRDGYGFSTFMIDRAVRIFLPFLPSLVLIAICDQLLFGNGRQNVYAGVIQIGVFPFLMNSLMLFDHPVVVAFAKLLRHRELAVHAFGTAAPFWTVVLEWWIYVAFAIGTFVVFRGRRLGFVGWLVWGFAVAPPLYLLTTGSGLVLAWIVGMVFSFGWAQVSRLTSPLLWLCLTAAIVVATGQLMRNEVNLYQPNVVIGISIAVIIGHALVERGLAPNSGGRATNLFVRFSTFLSGYSYSLYLLHYSILIYLQSLGANGDSGWSGAQEFAVGIVTCNLFALVFWFLVERHYREWQKRVRVWFGLPTGVATFRTDPS